MYRVIDNASSMQRESHSCWRSENPEACRFSLEIVEWLDRETDNFGMTPAIKTKLAFFNSSEKDSIVSTLRSYFAYNFHMSYCR